MNDRPSVQTKEITPAMIEASLKALLFAVAPEDIHFLESSDLVKAVYEAMAFARSSRALSTADSGL